MKFRSLAPVALACATPAAASPTPQINDAQALLRGGDPLPGGALVVAFDEVAMSDHGDWLALVVTDQGTFETDGLLVINGSVVLREGSPLPSGEVVGQILGADLTSDGTAVWAHRLDPSGVLRPEALYVDGVERLRTGAVLSGPGIPAGTELLDLGALRADGDLVLLETHLLVGGLGYDAIVLMNLAAGGAPTFRLLAREGDTPPALGGPIVSLASSFDVAADGTAAFTVLFDDGGTLRRAIATDQGWRAVHGTPGPFSGSTWSHSLNPYVACAAGGRYLISGEAEVPGNLPEGVIVGPGGVLAREGQPFGPIPGETVGFFAGSLVGMSTAGTPAWIAPVDTFDDVLVSGSTALLRESTSTISGSPVGVSLRAGLSGRIAVGSGGRELLLVTAGPAGEDVLTLVELEVGTVDGACMAAPNSTGAVGLTRGLGTGIAAANDLVVQSSSLPPGQFGLLIASRTSAFAPGAGGSAGNLCLGGAIGRFNGSVAAADGAGVLATTVDLTAVPQGSGAVSAQSGETWYFQRWHRDVVGGAATSNFTTSLAITFR